MIHLKILTPEIEIFSGEVESLSVPSASGVLGILPHHTNLTALLVQGELTIKSAVKTESFSVGGGLVRIDQKQVTVLVTRAVHSDQLDEQAINESLLQASIELNRKPTGADLLQNASPRRQSIVDLKILRKHRSTHN